MKTIAGIVLLLATIFATNAFAQNTPSEYALFKQEESRIDEQRRSRTITRTEMLKEKLAAAKTYMPNDRVTQAYLTSLVEYSEQLDTQKISKKEFDALAAARGERFLAAVKDLQQAEDRLAQTQQESPQVVYVQGNSAVNDAIPAAVFLNKVGQAFSTSYGQYLQPMPMCSYGRGTVMCY